MKNAIGYHDRLRTTKFALVPRGHGVFSRRLVEVLAAGAIPVIISNGWILPFEEVRHAQFINLWTESLIVHTCRRLLPAAVTRHAIS